MSLTSIFFLIVLLICFFGSFIRHPIFGVIGYLIVYTVPPVTQWWYQRFIEYGIRFNLLMSIAILVGMIIHSNKLKMPEHFHSQEILFYLFVVWVFLSRFVGFPLMDTTFAGLDTLDIKLFKVAIFIWMLTRIVTDIPKFDIWLWALILTGLYLGYDAFYAPTGRMGRLDSGVGGSDFSSSNFLAAHFAILLPFAGILFLKSKLRTKAIIFIAVAFIINGIILCRTRGVFLAIVVGAPAALFFSPKKQRKQILLGMALMAALFFFLVDPGFIIRMSTLEQVSNVENMDTAALGRLKIWHSAIEIFKAHPLGVGNGNFKPMMEQYNPEFPLDAHNTYIRTLVELGLPGFLLLLAMILNAFRLLRRMGKNILGSVRENTYQLYLLAVFVALVIYLSAGMFASQTYVEDLYIMMVAMPIMAERMIQYDMINVQTAGINPSNTQ